VIRLFLDVVGISYREVDLTTFEVRGALGFVLREFLLRLYLTLQSDTVNLVLTGIY